MDALNDISGEATPLVEVKLNFSKKGTANPEKLNKALSALARHALPTPDTASVQPADRCKSCAFQWIFTRAGCHDGFSHATFRLDGKRQFNIRATVVKKEEISMV